MQKTAHAVSDRPATAAPGRANVLLGIFFMCLAGTVFPIMNGIVQVLSPRYPSLQIVALRTASHLLLVLAFFAPSMGLVRLVSTSAPGWQIGRSILLMGSTICFFTGVKYLALAKAASISFTAPFIVALLAVPMLGETLSLGRFAAVIAGFIGVLVVIRPGTDVFEPASLYILCSAMFYAVYQIFTRRVAGRDAPETSAVYSALVGTFVMLAIMPWVWTPLLSVVDAVLMVSLGALGAIGHYCVARAFTYAPAGIVSPFQYWQLVGSVAVGYILMGHLPDRFTWLGAAIIVAAGLYIGWRETREKPSAA